MKFACAAFILAIGIGHAFSEGQKVDALISNLEEMVAETNQTKYTRAEMESRPQVLEKTGGFIDAPATGVAIVIIDARAKAGAAADQFAQVFGNLSKMNVVVEKTPINDSNFLAKAITRREALKVTFALMIVEDPLLPGLSTYPEERIAVINFSKYQSGNDPVRREERVVKELWRSLGFVSGIGYAPFKNDVFQPIYSVDELDAEIYQVMQPMNFQKMYSTMSKFGAKRARHIPYRLAVVEGWAPAPTNQYQQAIWDKIHQLPTEPIKIKPEATKVKE